MNKRTGLAVMIGLALLSGAASRCAVAATRLTGDLPHQGSMPLLDLPGIDTEYGVAPGPAGARLRVIVTKPAGRSGRLPAVLFLPWLSCDTVDFSASSSDGWSLMLRQLITQSNMLWERVDKSGVGDSTGTPCNQLDYETELAQYQAAYANLMARTDVDPERVVIFGASMGATYAPLIAAGRKLAGVIIWGGGATTWFERMLAFERHALELGGADPARLSIEMTARANFFSQYLLQGESAADIARSNPELGQVWSRLVGTEGDLHYGRPQAFHQQAQQQNWAAAWARVKAPVLATYGEYDWFESRDAVKLIADIVNHERPGTARFQEIPGLNHHFSRYASPVAAFHEQGGFPEPSEFVRAVLAWLRGLP
jgi:pimeloyl-ACP methyl ester carboxylesterase